MPAPASIHSWAQGKTELERTAYKVHGRFGRDLSLCFRIYAIQDPTIHSCPGTRASGFLMSFVEHVLLPIANLDVRTDLGTPASDHVYFPLSSPTPYDTHFLGQLPYTLRYANSRFPAPCRSAVHTLLSSSAMSRTALRPFHPLFPCSTSQSKSNLPNLQIPSIDPHPRFLTPY